MKKHSTFKKILSVILSITILFSLVVISAPHAHAAEETVTLGSNKIVYLTDSNGKRIGVKSALINGKTYYDIDSGKSTVDLDDSGTVNELFEKAILAEYGGYSAAELWANIASLMFEEAGTDHGYNDNGWGEKFDDWFTVEGDSNRDFNLVNVLSQKDARKQTDDDKVKSTGWGVATNLNAIQIKMSEEIQSMFGGHCTASDVRKYSTGSTDGFELMNSSTPTTAIYNIVSAEQNDLGERFYTSFGIAYYDFQLVPVADDSLEYVTAAEGYDSIKDASSANVPGVKFYPTSFGTPTTSFIENTSNSDSTVSAAYSETQSTTVTNYMESTETYTFGQSIESSTEFDASFPLLANARTSLTIGFTTEQSISTAYGTENSITDETTTESTAEVFLPAHTKIGITQQSGTSETVLSYDCPVYITYKVCIFAMNGKFYDLAETYYFNTSQYDQGGMCVIFGTTSSDGGLTAIDNLYNRAVLNCGKDGFEESYGNCEGYWEKHNDGDPTKSYDEVPWEKFINHTQKNGCGLTGTQIATRLKKFIPMSASGGEMSVVSNSINTEITSVQALYDLDYTQIEGPSVYTVAPGGTIDLSKVGTKGYNEFNISYYGYIGDNGSWVLCDASGNEQSSVDGVRLEEISNYQMLTAEKEGKYFVKFVIDDKSYLNSNGGFITQSDLSSSAVVTVNVNDTGLNHICTEGPWQTTISPTCTSEGEQIACCISCSRVMYSQSVPKLQHAVSVFTTPATCFAEGKETELCGMCLSVLSSVITPKLEHTLGDWITHTDADCETTGEKTRACTVCHSVIETEEIPAHGHAAYWITVKEATCKDIGREEYVCSICKAVLETREIAKLEHVPGKWEITKDSTCTQSGLMQQTCAICSALLGEPKVIEPHEHQLGSWETVLEPGCETEGEKIRACTVCKGTIETEAIPALGHTEGVWVTALEATCETQGEHHKTCTRCGTLIETKRIEALGHVPGPAMTCVTDQVCLVCEEVLVPADGRSHTWTEWTTYKQAKFFTEEQQRRECSSCYIEEYRFVTGTAGCHKYCPHEDGEDCSACDILAGSNSFFRTLARVIVNILTENIITTVLFPFFHGHFHESVNLDSFFGT